VQDGPCWASKGRLFRRRWITVKLAVAVGATVVVFAVWSRRWPQCLMLPPPHHRSRARTGCGWPYSPAVALTLLLFNTALGVYKPGAKRGANSRQKAVVARRPDSAEPEPESGPGWPTARIGGFGDGGRGRQGLWRGWAQCLCAVQQVVSFGFADGACRRGSVVGGGFGVIPAISSRWARTASSRWLPMGSP
jgi:hypothetical protein